MEPAETIAAGDPCPSCGGAGGGPFGRAGSAWDDEDYLCPRCEGTGLLALPLPHEDDVRPVARPGIVKAPAEERAPDQKTGKRKASA